MGVGAVFSHWLSRAFPKQTLGRRGEAAAARFLKRRGYRIVARGQRLRGGEIDIVAVAPNRTIVFVEVKTRETDQLGHPAEAVNAAKQRRLTRLAVTYLKCRGLLEYASRFDVIAVIWPKGKWFPRIEHFENAFEAVGKGELYS
ncbi:MAG: YraN family protein [Pirellulales bacterium]|nr:YraN family protein [Pirellulales bacterium]